MMEGEWLRGDATLQFPLTDGDIGRYQANLPTHLSKEGIVTGIEAITPSHVVGTTHAFHRLNETSDHSLSLGELYAAHDDDKEYMLSYAKQFPLHVAALRGDNKRVDKILQSLLHNGEYAPEINLLDTRHHTALYYSLKGDHLSIATTLLEAGVNTDMPDKNGCTLLHLCIRWDKPDYILLLLRFGASRVLQDNAGYTPLMLACASDHLSILHHLLPDAAEDELNSRSHRDGTTALHVAVMGHRVRVVALLLQAKGLVTGVCDDKGFTPLHLAILLQNKDIIREIALSRPRSILEIDGQGRTVLHYAVSVGDVTLLKFFLSLPDVVLDAVDWLGRTTLHYAVSRCDQNMVETLLQAGASDRMGDSNGATALHYAARNSDACVLKLCNSSHFSYSSDVKGRTPLHYAAAKGYVAAMELLIDVGVDLDEVDVQNTSPLMLVCEGGFRDAAAMLLNAGADTEIIYPDDGMTAQMLAARSGILDVFPDFALMRDLEGRSTLHFAAICPKSIDERLFRTHDVDDVDNAGKTPLHFAAYTGNLEPIRSLIAHGADLQHREQAGVSAVHWASGQGHVNVVSLLAQHGANLLVVDEEQLTPLDYAVRSNASDVVDELRRLGCLCHDELFAHAVTIQINLRKWLNRTRGRSVTRQENFRKMLEEMEQKRLTLYNERQLLEQELERRLAEERLEKIDDDEVVENVQSAHVDNEVECQNDNAADETLRKAEEAFEREQQEFERQLLERALKEKREKQNEAKEQQQRSQIENNDNDEDDDLNYPLVSKPGVLFSEKNILRTEKRRSSELSALRKEEAAKRSEAARNDARKRIIEREKRTRTEMASFKEQQTDHMNKLKMAQKKAEMLLRMQPTYNGGTISGGSGSVMAGDASPARYSAATKIQALVRGWLMRRRYAKAMVLSKKLQFREEARHDIARLRGIRDKMNAVLLIQGAFNNHKWRKFIRDDPIMKQLRAQQATLLEATTEAIKIQAQYRGRVAHDLLEQLSSSPDVVKFNDDGNIDDNNVVPSNTSEQDRLDYIANRELLKKEMLALQVLTKADSEHHRRDVHVKRNTSVAGKLLKRRSTESPTKPVTISAVLQNITRSCSNEVNGVPTSAMLPSIGQMKSLK